MGAISGRLSQLSAVYCHLIINIPDASIVMMCEVPKRRFSPWRHSKKCTRKTDVSLTCITVHQNYTLEVRVLIEFRISLLLLILV